MQKELGNANSPYLPARRRERKDFGEEFFEEDAISFADLAADLFYLVRNCAHRHGSRMQALLPSAEEDPQLDGAQMAKRQRSSSVMDSLISACAADENPTLQLWLAVCFFFCSKHPHAVSFDSYEQMIGMCSKHLEKKTARIGIDVWSLRVLTSLASLSPLVVARDTKTTKLRESISGEVRRRVRCRPH